MARLSEADWRRKLDGSDQGVRPKRRFWRAFPAAPRCKMCLRPFAGPGGALMRMLDLGPWEKNPRYCRACYQDIDADHGGAEIELSMLFADVRGSTSLAEGMAPRDFSDLLNRFYEVAARVLVEREAIVDKFVGDEVVGLFVPGMSGLDHAAQAIDAAVALLEGTGHGSDAGPWIPIGAGVHTGLAFVGSVGDKGVSDFTALGDAVNTTARLASVAQAGEILVSVAAADAAGLVGGPEQRRVQLRGRAEPVDVVVLGYGGASTRG
ncbi:MAG TPA: adenylate/guanylate cyclase domain-containing protein [Candidatus Limnocylindrales bacterium]|nr:adenylate/guanylate cyclase domain-containing protein [Candidatus Limnocylindrales bacterium]